MAANEMMVKRTAFVNLTHPGHASASANSTNTGVYIPAGAIITGVKFYSGGAVTGGASLSDARINLSVGTGLALGATATASNRQSALVVQTAVKNYSLSSADGMPVLTGGYLLAEYVSTGTAATGVTADFDVYVDYLFVADHD